MSVRSKNEQYEIVVIGGGIAGVCAAVAAARMGCKVAIVQNRSVFGGNASSEIRMHIVGANCHSSKANLRETGILEEILLENKHRNAYANFPIFDMILWETVYLTPNLTAYLNTNIDNVVTGLGGNFRYSPIFKNAVADTFIELTGYRNKDYKIAEAKTGKGHTPKVTVWHHAWQEKDGLYRMQLVDFSEHKKTYPHAGGCKLWIMNTHKKKKYSYLNYKHQYDLQKTVQKQHYFQHVSLTMKDFWTKNLLSESDL